MDSILSFIEHLIKNEETREVVSNEINSTVKMLKNGWTVEKIMGVLSGSRTIRKFKIELAKGRISAHGRFSRADNLWFDEFSSRYSTPELISVYRAERLSVYNILDIGSGAGMQSIFFGMKTSATGIEMNRRRYLLSELNRLTYSESRAKFLNASFPECINSLSFDDPVAVFSDPLRLPGRKSDPEKLSPSPSEIIKALNDRTKVFAFDLPLLMPPAAARIEGEYEYASIEGRLARLTLYTGEIAVASRSAVILPEKKVYRGEPRKLRLSEGYSDFITVPDPALVKAGLLWQVAEEHSFSKVYEDSRRLVISSPEVNKNVPGEHFQLLTTCTADNYPEVVSGMKPRSVFFRFSVESDLYYGLRNRIRTAESSDLVLYLFRHGDTILVCSKIKGL